MEAPRHDSDAEPAHSPIPITRFAPATSLVGRGDAVRMILDLLGGDDTRLVSLTGPGGVGKTRLATHVAQHRQALFVPLASVTEATYMLPAIVEAAGVAVDPGTSLVSAVSTRFGDGDQLLILDNLEQIDGASDVVAELLHADPRVRVLVTSRTRLRLSAEHEVGVLPLEWPDAETATLATIDEFPAAKLFVDRTRAVNPSFRLTPGNVRVIAEICRRLDGLPLAIELAAARGRFLSPEAILARLERRLELLSGGAHDLPERHRTMRDTIEWSYDLLEPREAAFLRRASMFVGGFTIEAAEAMSGDLGSALDLSGSLTDHGFLLSAVNANGEPRLIMLETVREYGLEQLAAAGEIESITESHASIYLAFAEELGPRLRSPAVEQLSWWNRGIAEIGNLRAAIDWYARHARYEDALRVLIGLDWFWTDTALIPEGLARLESILELSGTTIERRRQAKGHTIASMLAVLQNDDARSVAHGERALALWRESGDQAQILDAVYSLANAAYDRCDFEPLRVYATEARDIASAIGDDWFFAASVTLLAGHARDGVRNYPLAVELNETAMAVFRQLGEHGHINAVISGAALASLLAGDVPKATETYLAALEIEESKPSDRTSAQSIFAGLAMLAARLGDDRTAVQLAAAAERAAPHEMMKMRRAAKQHVDRELDQVRARLGETTYASLWTMGQRLDFDGAAEFARAFVAAKTPSPASLELHSLTKREREIIKLLADGKTDGEIAEQLFISRRTASQHVSAILRKLGVSSRAAAAAVSARQGGTQS